MLRTLALLAACALPAAAQESGASSAYGLLQYSYLRMRSDNGTVQGASGSGLTLRQWRWAEARGSIWESGWRSVWTFGCITALVTGMMQRTP
jgi:hypothetical protein